MSTCVCCLRCCCYCFCIRGNFHFSSTSGCCSDKEEDEKEWMHQQWSDCCLVQWTRVFNVIHIVLWADSLECNKWMHQNESVPYSVCVPFFLISSLLSHSNCDLIVICYLSLVHSLIATSKTFFLFVGSFFFFSMANIFFAAVTIIIVIHNYPEALSYR